MSLKALQWIEMILFPPFCLPPVFRYPTGITPALSSCTPGQQSIHPALQVTEILLSTHPLQTPTPFMSQGMERTQGTVRRNLCHQGSLESRRCVIFPISLFVLAPCLWQGDHSCCRHTLLLCGPVWFPRWQSIAHVALQNYSMHSLTSPKAPEGGWQRTELRFFWRWIFTSELLTPPTPYPWALWLPRSLILPQTQHWCLWWSWNSFSLSRTL